MEPASTPATLKPLVEPLGSAGHAAVIVDLPCDDATATLEQYADAVRAALPDDLGDVVLVGYSFGGFTAARIAVEHPELPVVYLAAFREQPQRLAELLVAARG